MSVLVNGSVIELVVPAGVTSVPYGTELPSLVVGVGGKPGPPGLAGTPASFDFSPAETVDFDEPAEFVRTPGEDGPHVTGHFILPRGPQGVQGPGFVATGNFRSYTNYVPNDVFVVPGVGTFLVTAAHRSGLTWDANADKLSQWSYRGPTGDRAIFEIGTVETLEANEDAYVENVGTDSDPVLNLGIPRGKTLTQIFSNNLATALNIGPDVGKNHWSLQLSIVRPIASVTNPNPTIPTSFLTVSQNEMVNGITYGEAQPDPDGRAVRLATRIDAIAGTSGSATPRAEFRELGLQGENAAWDPANGTHLFEGTYAIEELPTDSVQQTVVLAQVHNNNNDVFVLRTQVNTDVNGVRNLRLLIRINGSSAVANTIVQNVPVVGQEFDTRILIQDGYLYFWHAAAGTQFGDNFPVLPTYRTTVAFQGIGVDVKAQNLNALGYGVKTDLTPYTSGSQFVGGLPAWYFKFGQYLQTNAAQEATPIRAIGSSDPALKTGNPAGWFRTRWSRIRHHHVISGTPWPAVQRVDYGMYVPGPQGPQGATAQIASVSTEALPTGTAPYARNDGSQSAAALVFGIPAGAQGRSAYEVAQSNGFSGTQLEWLASLIGPRGLSAYQVAQANGFTGSASDWLASLRGQAGLSAYDVAVANGYNGSPASWLASLRGATGDSAYQAAVAAGFTGTQTEWLASLRGPQGNPGPDAYAVAVANGFVGDRTAWLASLKSTEPGPAGSDAYQVAVAQGFVGDRAAWLASLKGAKGDQGLSAYQVAVAGGYTGTSAEWLASLKGAKGDQGLSAYQVAVAGGYNGTEAQWLASLKGAKGDAGTIESATTKTIAAGGQPTVTLGGTPSARTIEFGLVTGNTGAQGVRGAAIQSGTGLWSKTQTPNVLLDPKWVPGDHWIDQSTFNIYVISAADLA